LSKLRALGRGVEGLTSQGIHATLPKKLTKDMNDANVSGVLCFFGQGQKKCAFVGTINLGKKISSEKGGFYESQSVLLNVFGGLGQSLCCCLNLE
jgi:hypothetical protein